MGVGKSWADSGCVWDGDLAAKIPVIHVKLSRLELFPRVRLKLAPPFYIFKILNLLPDNTTC